MSCWPRPESTDIAALALTDANLCGALEFARLANSLGIKPVTGGELNLTDGSRIVLLTKARQGYGNISRLFTLANANDRRQPQLDPLPICRNTPDGVVYCSPEAGTGRCPGCCRERSPEGCPADCWANTANGSAPDGVYVELQQNFIRGDTPRNRELARLAHGAGRSVSRQPTTSTTTVLSVTACNTRLAAARRNTTIEQALPYISGPTTTSA